MDFHLTEDQKLLQRSVREFAEAEIAPVIAEHDETQAFPHQVFRKLGEMGFMGIVIPEEYGGAGMGYREYAIIIEEVSRVYPSVGLSLAAHNSLCTGHINLFGSQEQKGRYVVPLARGEKLGAWGLTEPGSGSDAAGMRTTAVEEGDHFVLNGQKTFITHGTIGDIAVVMARTDPEQGPNGISAFIVERGTPGFSAGKKENKLGWRASDTGDLVFENCRVPKANLLGERNAGFKNALTVLDGGRISIAALSLGTAKGALDAAVAYAKEREQFGRPIARFQGIQFMIADMMKDYEASRLLTMRAASLRDQGSLATLESAMAKVYASEASVRIATQAVQVFGGYGVIKEYPVEMFYRDAKINTIGEGTTQIQLLVIARQIFGP